MDVLVCGGCHSVFHFIQDLQNHRQQKDCSEQSSIRDGNVVRIRFLLPFDFILNLGINFDSFDRMNRNHKCGHFYFGKIHKIKQNQQLLASYPIKITHGLCIKNGVNWMHKIEKPGLQLDEMYKHLRK